MTETAAQELGEGLKSVFATGDRLQERVVDSVFDSLPGSLGGVPDSGRLDTTAFVVVGEGLAAGMGHFSLSEEFQKYSFPALVASSMRTPFRQPLLEAPGLGDVASFASQPVLVPNQLQSTVLRGFPPQAPDLSNVSVPGFTLEDAFERRPNLPLVHRTDSRQTLLNFILGLPDLLRPDAPRPSQVEYAVGRRPSLILVELGYHEALEAALKGDPARLPEASAFASRYRELLAQLGQGGATVLATTIPNPLDTAYFSSLETAAKILKTEASFLQEQYGLAPDDLVTLDGLVEIGYQLTARKIQLPLTVQPTMGAAAASAIKAGIEALNGGITQAAGEVGAKVYDLHGFFHRVADGGLGAGSKDLTAELLGGFYLLNGIYPGPAGQALVANDFLAFLNREFEAHLPPIDAAAVAQQDPNTLSRLAPGPASTEEFLEPRTLAELPPPRPLEPPPQETPIQTVYPELQPGKQSCTPAVGIPAGGFQNPALAQPLKLPEGLEQSLDLNPAGSYFGDALRAVDCPDDRAFLPGFPAFGICGSTLFGGLALTDSHLSGQVHLKFSPPDENNVSHFEIRHPGGLVGEDGALVAPQFFKLPSQLNVVNDVPALVSSGDLNLTTGWVTNLHYNVTFLNTPILALFGVNPKLPPVAMLFPGAPNGGSTWARFEQRSDGKLDFTLSANLFLPLGLEAGGDPIRFPLPFSTPRLECASIVARGTSLHPHIHLTTKPPQGPEASHDVPEIPVNTVQEFTPFVRNTNFGDVFGLAIPEWGGETTGRSHLMGRIRIQFGARAGNSVPMALSVLPPGGLLSQDPRALPYLPPGTSRGMIGFNEVLKLPSGLAYHQSELACPDDPFVLTVGAVDTTSGRVLDELLARGYVAQALFLALIDVEPCTPADAFNYQGPALFERGANGDTVFRFNGSVFLPYPKGFHFPSPNPGGRPPFTVQAQSRLDPFRRMQAMHNAGVPQGVLRGEAAGVVSSTEQRFSYRFVLPCGSAAEPAIFEYTNHTQGGTFRLTALSWLSCTHSRGSSSSGDPDTVTFSGFGTWSEEPGMSLHQISAQISTAQQAPYVGILLDGGRTSNANTKPPDIEDSLP